MGLDGIRDIRSKTLDKQKDNISPVINKLYSKLSVNAGELFRKMIKKRYEKYVIREENSSANIGQTYKELVLT